MIICLKAEHINQLKAMGKSKGSDSMFVSVLLSAVFGDEVLKESSAGGRQNNYTKTSHKALDANKLKFIKGKFIFNLKEAFDSKLFFLIDCFEERVGNSTERKNLFVQYVNKKCCNLRR